MSVIQNLSLLKIMALFMPPELNEQNNWMTKGTYIRATCGGGQSMLLICIASEMHKNGLVN